MDMVFSNMDPSPLLRSWTESRLGRVLQKFAKGRHAISTHVKLEMHNGPQQPGRDHFECRVTVEGEGLRRPLVLRVRNTNMYRAVAEAAERLLPLVTRWKKVGLKQRRLRRRQRAQRSLRRHPDLSGFGFV